MSIAKLFVKVFGEDIFERRETVESTVEVEPATCSNEADGRGSQDTTLAEQMGMVKDWLLQKLDFIELQVGTALRSQRQQMQYRVGHEMAIFDIDFSSTVRTSTDRLSVRSQGSFNTVKSNVCVYGGRWMWEVQLHTKGIMQMGWVTNRCMFNENTGVGDSKYSYGYDGSKQQIWHISTKKYGDKWEIGDIIGATLDIDNERIEFFRNGKSMGVAFDSLEKGPGLAFYAGISLGYNQGVLANFGNTPLKYPIEGFMPLQAKPFIKLQKADLLLGYLVNVATIISRTSCCKNKKPREHKVSTKKMVYVVFITLLIEKLTPLLFCPYVIEDKLLLHITNLCVIKQENDRNSPILPGSEESILGALLSILWNYLETDESKFVLRKIANALLNKYAHTNKALDHEQQKKTLMVMNCLCTHTRTRKNYLEYKFFKKHYLPLLLYQRPPEYSYMQEFLTNHMAWTEGIGGPRSKYMAMVEKLNKTYDPLYEAQRLLLNTLLTNTDGDESTPSSRKIFLNKFRRYVMDLSMEQRPFHSFFMLQSSILYPIDSQVSLSFLCIVLDTTKRLFEKELPGTEVEIDPKYFYDGTFDYVHFDRLGGVLSHLRKVHRGEVQSQLGEERTNELLDEERNGVRVAEMDPTIFLTTTALNNIQVVGRPVGPNGPSTFTHFFNQRFNPNIDASPGNVSTHDSLFELIDICIMFYYTVGHKYVIKVVAVRDEIANLNEILFETKAYREDVERKLTALGTHASVCMNERHCLTMQELKMKFNQRENVFAKRSIELARKQVWHRAVALSKYRRLLLIWMLERTLRTLNAASRTGVLFAFVPEIYLNVLPILLDTVMDFSNHDLLIQFDVTDSECVINMAAEFLGVHAADPRIVLASCKDSMLQALGTLTCHKSGIVALERSTKKSQTALIKALLRPYENRAWGQSNWLILRFWLGDGFAYRDARLPTVWQGGNEHVPLGVCRSRARSEQHTGLLHHVAPPNPSKHFQKLIGLRLMEDEPFATTFLNSVLSQLNWAFSEFVLLLQEIQNTANRQENAVFEPKQLKICSMCFELTVSLMRCLEMIINVAPNIFQDPSRTNGDLILNRVYNLVSQVLSRVTVPPGCFQFIVDLCCADLNSVTHFPVITAALGILLALMRTEFEHEKLPAKVTRLTRALLTDPSFQFANLEFALGEIKTPILQQAEIPRGNFDPQTRAHIDPLTNDVRVPMPTTSSKRIRADPPIIKFSLTDYPTHVTNKEIEDVRRLIEMLRVKQSLLSEITLPSEDSLCPICCAKPIAVVFEPCKHQSCSNCILQHLMNSKVCFYCKTLIQSIQQFDGTVIYTNTDYMPAPVLYENA